MNMDAPLLDSARPVRYSTPMAKLRSSGIALALVASCAACGAKAPESSARREEAPTPAAAAPAAAGQPAPAAEEEPRAVLMSVHPQWIIDDSQRKVEITLYGRDLPGNPSVTSSSHLLRVESVDSDPVRTLVLAVMDPAAPAGDYQLQYMAPGQAPIPFTLRYEGAP